MIQPPAMTPDEIARHPAASIRVVCYQHGLCLYAGEQEPPGGDQAVREAAGCPVGPDARFDDCPNRPVASPG